MMGLSGLGGVIGSVWVAQRGERIDRVNIMTINAMLFGLLLIAFALAENFYLALVPLVIANACASASQTLNNTAAQLLVDDQQRGRMSAFMMMAFGLTPLGVLPLAYLAQLIGVQWSTVTGCLLLLIVISGFYLSSATLRNMDQTVAEKLGRNKRS
jgi:predicted MFS family arabinose efflux permease